MVIQHRTIEISSDVILDPRFPAVDARVWAAMQVLEGMGEFPTVARVAEVARCSRTAVRTALWRFHEHLGLTEWYIHKVIDGCGPDPRRAAIHPDVRTLIYERDGNKCTYCGDGEEELTIDHVKPVIFGGTNDPSNLVTACCYCNTAKGIKSVEEFRTGARA